MTAEQLRLPTNVRRNAREPPRAHPIGAHAVELILVGIAYFALASLGLHLASINPSATPIWPPTGLAIVAIVLVKAGVTIGRYYLYGRRCRRFYTWR